AVSFCSCSLHFSRVQCCHGFVFPNNDRSARYLGALDNLLCSLLKGGVSQFGQRLANLLLHKSAPFVSRSDDRASFALQPDAALPRQSVWAAAATHHRATRRP